ncbi:uncharacterized protein DS421_17g577070 [Arachis hypogaea]|nr:uncharacterized protein DS421_17g577070 [Arachis hypogaea]
MFLHPSPSATNSPTNPDLLTAPSSSLSSVYHRTTATHTSSLLSPSPFLVAPLPLRRPPRLHAAAGQSSTHQQPPWSSAYSSSTHQHSPYRPSLRRRSSFKVSQRLPSAQSLFLPSSPAVSSSLHCLFI